MSKKEEKIVPIPVNGSLGLLAQGDIALKAWRKIRDQEAKKELNPKEGDKDNKEKEKK